MNDRDAGDARRVKILRTVLDVVRREGYAKTTIRDVTRELQVSTGFLHHHFAGRDALLAEAFELAATEELAAIARALDDEPTPTAGLLRLLDLYCPKDLQDDAFVIWHDARTEALRNPRMREITARLAMAWVKTFEDILREGVERGEFRCADSRAAAYRLLAVVDGLSNHVMVHGTLSRWDFRLFARRAAELETGVTLPEPAPSAASPTTRALGRS